MLSEKEAAGGLPPIFDAAAYQAAMQRTQKMEWLRGIYEFGWGAALCFWHRDHLNAVRGIPEAKAAEMAGYDAACELIAKAGPAFSKWFDANYRSPEFTHLGQA